MTNIIKRSKPLLGTFVEVSILADVNDDTLVKLSNLAFLEIEKIHKMMSFHNPDSELSMINSHAYKKNTVLSNQLEEVIQQALELSHITNGLYDITIADELMRQGGLPKQYPSSEAGSWRDINICNNHITFEKDIKIDLGGIAKGYAVDRAMEILQKQDIEYKQISINAGGDLRMLNWQGKMVYIRHPSPKKHGQFIEIPMKAPALATSAPNYTNKNSLIINPISKEKLRNRESISVFADKCILADALTKIFFLFSDFGTIAKLFDTSMVTINEAGNLRQVL